METTTNEGNEMDTQTRRQEIQEQLDKLNAKAANVWSRKESRKFADESRALKAELKKLS